ncbi:MAG: hypothetical protein KJP05_09435 [Deltaproteobacteria bacterium]|nr:hypothetical protein [Deltaproteobacteria bacterium]
MKYSVIVLFEEPHKDFAQFILSLHSFFSSRKESFEILIMANGAGGFLRNELSKLEQCNARLKVFELNAATPEAVCLKAGLKESSGEILVICGCYKQLDNTALAKILNSLDNATDIISPWRQYRVDPPFNQFQSKVFNMLVRWITKTNLHDLNCNVKIVRRKVVGEIKLYGNMYRFLPILAEQHGFKTKEVKCQHYQERGKTGFYSLSSYITRLIDIGTLYFNTRFTRKPLRFFSCIGLVCLVSGLLIAFYVFGQKILLSYPIGGRPILLLAIFFMFLGVQAASVGLLGEMVVFTHGRHNKEYTIEKRI